jgi:glycosyltransferase involved in cell wall biosynthesis
MRVAYLITRADAVGGASIHVRDMASAVIERGGEALVLIGGRGPVTDELASRGVPFEVLPHLCRQISPWRDAVAVATAARALRRWRPDLLSAHTAKGGVVGRLAGAIAGVPVVYTPHGLTVGDRLGRRAGLVFGMVERALAPLARRIVLVSEAERQLALRCGVGRAEQLSVVHNGVMENALRARPELKPARIISVARFEQPKDHAALIDALAALKHLDWTLDLVGGGPLELVVKQQVERLGLASRVRFRGARTDVAELLAQAQVFALSSRSEGLPRSILEAMRAGLPVVASRVGGVAEQVEDGVTGLLVDGSPMAALNRLLVNPELRRTMGEAGRRTYERRFRFERTLERTLRIYDEIAGRPALEAAAPAGGF